MDSFDTVPPHAVIRDWLGSQMVERLLAYAKSNEHRFEESRVMYGTSGTLDHVDTTRRISRKLDDLGNFKQELKAKARELMPTVFEMLRCKPFEPKFELELVAHGDGAFFARHLDTLTGRGRLNKRHRVISAVYYFYTLPKVFSGGTLRLHSLAATGREGTFVDIPPDYDTIVCFPSMFPHEVLPVQSPSRTFLNSRFALNCWVYRATN